MWELVSWFQMEYPDLVRAMKNSNHHNVFEVPVSNGMIGDPISLNPYHLESDVWTHTMMVCKQAENASYEVQIAALLHDIGKPSTRAVNPKNGRVSFFNHDSVSAFMSLEIIKRPELGLSKEQQVRIFNMIALHTQMFKLDKIQIGKIGDFELVDALEQLRYADHCGRFTSVHSQQYEPRDINCLREGPRETNKEVLILCGLPASGKSSWRNNMRRSYRLVSRDSIIEEVGKGESYNEKWNSVNQKNIDKLLQDDFRDAKEWGDEGVTLVVDMTHMSKKSRRKSLSHFGKEYKKKCVVFLTDLPTLFERNEKREGKVIDREVIDRMMKSFYPPTYEEFDEIEYVI